MQYLLIFSFLVAIPHGFAQAGSKNQQFCSERTFTNKAAGSDSGQPDYTGQPRNWKAKQIKEALNSILRNEKMIRN